MKICHSYPIITQTQLFRVIVRELPEKAKRLKIEVLKMGNFSFKTIVIQTFN